MTNYDFFLWKGVFINDVINKYKFTDYLELGICNGETWKNVHASNKVGVDADPNCKLKDVMNCTTDEYFEGIDNCIKFDLVFIDCIHVYDNGIIIFHDIAPRSERETDPEVSGDCFKFWISLVDNYPKNCYTFTGHKSAYGSIIHFDRVGIFFKNNLKEIDTSIFNKMDSAWSYLNNNMEKYILSINYEI